MILRRNRRKRNRALTLVEVLITCSIMGVVFMAAAFVQSSTLKQIRALYGDARTLHRAHLVMERVRYQIAMAAVGSVQTLDSGHSVDYVNPNNTIGQISGFRYRGGQVFFYEDITAAASTPGQGIGPVRNIMFESLGAGNAVKVTVQTQQEYQWRLLPRPYSLRAEITLRN